LTVTLFYESYCPDCTGFINHKLYSAWTTFKGNVLFDLVPFGKAKQYYVDGHWVFICQHKEKECLGNKLHACGAWQACGDTGTRGCDVSKLSSVMDFIHCLLTKNPEDQLKATPQCAKTAGLDGSAIITCANGDQGNTLLNHYGNQTTAFIPRITEVPTVALNGKYDKQAEEDLVGEICRLKPELCMPRLPEVISV